MTVTVEGYEKQYGYSYSYDLVCSCGHEERGRPGTDFDTSVRAHKQQAVYEALGLEFETVKL